MIFRIRMDPLLIGIGCGGEYRNLKMYGNEQTLKKKKKNRLAVSV